jgi:hypothetical protein
MPSALKKVLRRLRAHRPVRRRGRFQLGPVDQLETRILPTAVVTFNGTAMTITGDTNSNVISVTRISGTQVRVNGNGVQDITVNGTNVPFFDFNLNGAFNLTAKFQAGNDVLAIGGIGVGLLLKSANITMGDGLGNAVTIVDSTLTGKLTVNTGDGVDAVTLVNTSVTGTTAINTGWGLDVVTIIDGVYTGPTTIRTDIGGGAITLAGSVGNRVKFVGTLSVTCGDDAEAVTIFRADTKAMSIDTGDNTDVVTIADALVNGGISVKTGAGVDVVTLATVVQSSTCANMIDTGSSQDFVTLAASSLSGPTTVNVGSGTANVLSINDVTFNNTFTYNSQGNLDFIAVETSPAFGGETKFVKAAKFNFGTSTLMTLSIASAASQTSFLSTVNFTGRSAVSTVIKGPNASFAIGPVVKNVNVI